MNTMTTMSAMKTMKTVSAMRPATIVERKDMRETYGHDERAINKHSRRVYRVNHDFGVKYVLNSTLDGCPPFYNLYYCKGNRIPPTHLTVNGEQYWGGGLSWPQAERLAFKAIRVYLASKEAKQR
jgi:hypothetical protein